MKLICVALEGNKPQNEASRLRQYYMRLLELRKGVFNYLAYYFYSI